MLHFVTRTDPGDRNGGRATEARTNSNRGLGVLITGTNQGVEARGLIVYMMREINRTRIKTPPK